MLNYGVQVPGNGLDHAVTITAMLQLAGQMDSLPDRPVVSIAVPQTNVNVQVTAMPAQDHPVATRLPAGVPAGMIPSLPAVAMLIV